MMWEGQDLSLEISQQVSSPMECLCIETLKEPLSVRNNPDNFIVTNKWKAHQQSAINGTDKDFKQLNKSALKEKATTSRVIYIFLNNIAIISI